MTVETRNAESQDKMLVWRTVRDCMASDLMRKNSASYITRLTDQTTEEYAAYVKRPAFFEATARTKQALTGMVFSKPAVVEGLEGYDYLSDNTDAAGANLHEFAQGIVEEQLQTGWGAVVVAHNGDPANPGTAARPSGRPYLKYYQAESILDWAFSAQRDEQGQIVRALASIRFLEEEYAPSPDDEFTQVCTPVIRVLDLKDGAFRERTFIEETDDKKQKKWIVRSEAFPRKNGQLMTFLPCRVISATGDNCPTNPPLGPMAEINASHWRTLADLEHAAHFCGLPTPYVAGVSTPTARANDVMSALDGSQRTGFENLRTQYQQAREPAIRLGSSRILTFENPQARAGFMEFTGGGVGTLERLADRKEAQMAALGARMLAPDKLAAESGVALSIRKSSETAPLVELVRYTSDALTWCLGVAVEWAGGDKAAVLYELNSEFVEITLDPTEITALVAAWQGGALSLDSLLYNFKRGGRLAEDRTVDDEKELIKIEGPPLSSFNEDPFANAPQLTSEPAPPNA